MGGREDRISAGSPAVISNAGSNNFFLDWPSPWPSKPTRRSMHHETISRPDILA